MPLGYLPARVQLCQCSASCVQNDAYIDIAMLVVFCVYWLLFQFNCYATKLACALERSCRAESETATLRCAACGPSPSVCGGPQLNRESSRPFGSALGGAALHNSAD